MLTHLYYSARTFARTPAVTTALLLTIAVGVGGNAAVHGFGRGLVPRDNPAGVTDGVFSVLARDSLSVAGPVSWEDYQWLAANQEAFEWIGAVRELRSTMEWAERGEVLSVADVTPSIAALFGLSVEDGVVLGDEAWHTYFNGRDVRKERPRIDNREVVISSIAPSWLDGLHAGRPVDVWRLLPDSMIGAADSTGRTLWVLGRLRAGASQSEVESVLRAHPTRSGELTLVRYTRVMPELVAGLARVQALLTLTAGAVLLMVCANIAAFAINRATARSHETAIRVALGAGRRDLIVRLLSDALVIATPGAAFGVLVAVWTSQVLPALLVDTDAAALALELDTAGIVIATGISVAAMILCGLAPLARTRFDRPQSVLRRGSEGTTKALNRLQAGLVVAQVATCCALVIATGFLIEAFRGALRAEAGRRLGDSVLATVQSHSDGAEYFQGIARAADSTRNDSSTVWVARPPGSSPTWHALRIERPSTAHRAVTMDIQAFTPATFQRVVFPVVAGRMFGGRDTPGGCRVAIVNRAAADQVLGGDAVGTAIVDPAGQRVQVIGVVDTREEASRPTIYYYPGQGGIPLDTPSPAQFRIPADRDRAKALIDGNVVSSGYFAGVGAQLLAGHPFLPAPAADGCRVAVINAVAAERYFPTGAIGAAVIDGAGRRTEIVGVVQSPPLGRFERRAEPAIYFHMNQAAARRMTLILDAGGSDDTTLFALQRRLQRVPGGAQPVITRLDEHLGRTALAPLRISLLLVRAAAALAIVLAIAGTYGALAEVVRRRRREIGVRLALGARRLRVIGLVLLHAAFLGCLGILAGTIAVVAARRALPGESPVAWFVWLAGPLVMVSAIGVASIVPVRLALKVDPLDVLRDD